MRMESDFLSVDWVASLSAGQLVRFPISAPPVNDPEGLKADFTTMTLLELCEWAKREKVAGHLNASEALAFARMTLTFQRQMRDMAFGSLQRGKSLDFLALAREELTKALLANDGETAKVFQVGFNVMLRHQNPRPVAIYAA